MDLTRKYKEGETLKDTNGNEFKLLGLDYTQMVFVAAKGKTFVMGDDNNQTQIAFDHDYWIGRFAITQELYEKLMVENPSTFEAKHRPVETVSWDEITNFFLPKLNQWLTKHYPAVAALYRFSLPSEAQWEYAAAGGQTWNIPKFEYAGSNNLNDVGWFRDNTYQKSTLPVGLKEPNTLGLYDMSGNVWEWCQDDYKFILSDLPPNGISYPNQKGSSKVLRGGSYYYRRFNCRLRSREYYYSLHRQTYFGFRVVFIRSSVHRQIL